MQIQKIHLNFFKTPFVYRKNNWNNRVKQLINLYEMNHENIKFMLIGCGRIGARHADHMENFGSIAAVCDIDKEKADKFGKI